MVTAHGISNTLPNRNASKQLSCKVSMHWNGCSNPNQKSNPEVIY